MRNQLLRDADWAGMAHGVEIRVPLVDETLLERLAPAIPALAPLTGKEALAQAPSLPLPNEIVNRAKTGFVVPTYAWTHAALTQSRQRQVGTKGNASRYWSRVIFTNLVAEDPAAAI
jgi:asparagine synthase (glutamine-hydrolysing)